VEILDPLPAGLPRGEFKEELQRRIEVASNRLILEAARSAEPPPISGEALARAEGHPVEASPAGNQIESH
jgi:1-acyl-sn-glycerol-3-phosphate acyltransferase